MKVKNFILLSLSMLLLGSCMKESGMDIRTNTFANEKIIPKGFQPNDSFSISAKQKGDQLFTREVSQKIATLLKNRGFTVTTAATADYNLIFSFGMDKSTHVRDVPVFIPDYGCWHYHHCHYNYGYRVAYVPEVYTLFHKILLVEVHRNRRFTLGKKDPVWQGTAHGYEEDSDLRDAIDYLLVTVFKYFGKNTKKYVKSRIKDDDKRVEKLRQDYFRPIGYEK